MRPKKPTQIDDQNKDLFSLQESLDLVCLPGQLLIGCFCNTHSFLTFSFVQNNQLLQIKVLGVYPLFLVHPSATWNINSLGFIFVLEYNQKFYSGVSSGIILVSTFEDFRDKSKTLPLKASLRLWLFDQLLLPPKTLEQ